MIIRPYCQSDCDILKDITVRCFNSVSSIDHNIERLFGLVDGKNWEWRKKQHIDDDIAAHPTGIFIADSEGSPIGYVTTRVNHETGIGSIPNLAVLPEFRKNSIGQALIRKAIGHLRAQGMKLVRIETLDTNTVGKNFYTSYGFKEVAMQIHYAAPLDDT